MVMMNSITAVTDSPVRAMFLVTFMFRMDIGAGETTDKGSDKAPVTCPAGMNTETYDTEAVP